MNNNLELNFEVKFSAETYDFEKRDHVLDLDERRMKEELLPNDRPLVKIVDNHYLDILVKYYEPNYKKKELEIVVKSGDSKKFGLFSYEQFNKILNKKLKSYF
ncbi:hypothetical protein ACFL1H_05180 [Nanoarchaeota archaeon]